MYTHTHTTYVEVLEEFSERAARQLPREQHDGHGENDARETDVLYIRCHITDISQCTYIYVYNVAICALYVILQYIICHTGACSCLIAICYNMMCYSI